MLKQPASANQLQMGGLVSHYEPMGIPTRRTRAPSLLVQCANFFKANYRDARVQRFGRACFSVDDGAGNEWSMHVYCSPVPGMLELTYLYVRPDFRAFGIGPELLNWVCFWADANACKLGLWAQAFEEGRSLGDEATYKLAARYAGCFGFEPVRFKREGGELLFIRMVRMPNG